MHHSANQSILNANNLKSLAFWNILITAYMSFISFIWSTDTSRIPDGGGSLSSVEERAIDYVKVFTLHCLREILN